LHPPTPPSAASPPVAAIHNRRRHSVFRPLRSFTFRVAPLPAPAASPPLVSLPFAARDSKNFTGPPLSFSLIAGVHPADFISPYTLHLIPRSFQFSGAPSPPPPPPPPPLPNVPRATRAVPSTVSSLRSFVTTQRAHLIHIIRAISVLPTRRPSSMGSFSTFSFSFVVAPSQGRGSVSEMSRQGGDATLLRGKTGFRKTVFPRKGELKGSLRAVNTLCDNTASSSLEHQIKHNHFFYSRPAPPA